MSLEAARAAKARELAGKTYAPLMREVEELAAKFKGREFELKFDDVVEINANLNPARREETLQTALNLRSWRKGPFKIDDIFIDSEPTFILPESAFISFKINLMKVDFPAPLGPTRKTKSPFSMLTLAFSSPMFFPYFFVTFVKVIIKIL